MKKVHINMVVSVSDETSLTDIEQEIVGVVDGEHLDVEEISADCDAA